MPTDTLQIAFEAIDKGLNKQINQIDADLTKLEKQINVTNKSAGAFGLSAEQIGTKLTQVGKAATVGLTLPIAGLAVAATKAASDLNETSNKIQTLFGDATDSVLKFSETAATSLGQSQKQALDAAADFAVFGKAAGLAGNDLVDFSEKNVQLAADMASFFNTSPEEAITAIGAAFRGESEPIRRYGVLINEASLKDQALRMGLIKTTTEALQPQQRVLAAQALILQQTSAAQGDFARTSEGLANQSRILNAQFQDTIAALGQSLLPIAVKVAGAANDLLKAFNNLDQPQKDLIVGFGLMAAAAGPVLTIGGKLVSVFGSISSVALDAAGGFIRISKDVGDTAKYLKEAGVSVESLKFAFQNLKASGALLGVELGVIIAGLIGIVKFLEATGQAANATNDELIKLANSGDLFSQAGATFEIVVNGQTRLNTAVRSVNSNLKASAKTYDEYTSGVLGAAIAAGTLTKAQADEFIATGKITDEFYHQFDVTQKIIDQTGLLTREQFSATKATQDHAYGVDLLSSSMLRGGEVSEKTNEQNQKLIAGLREYYTATRDANSQGLIRANELATQSIEVLRIAMAGAVGKEMENFKAKQDELQAKAAELQGVISTSYGRARDDAIKSLGEINDQLGNNAKAHEEATKRILFDIAAQQLATIQDPQIRAKAMNELALQWDLVDKATYDATESIIGATAKLAADNNVNVFKANLESIANKQLGIAPINIPVEPVLNEAALKAKPLPTVELPVTPKIDTAAVKAKKIEAVEIPVKKIDTPIIAPKVDTAQATKDIKSFAVDVFGVVPTEKKTTFFVDTLRATNDTQKMLTLFGLVPKSKDTAVNIDAKFALQTLGDIIKAFDHIKDKEVTVKVNYTTSGRPPEGFQHGGSYTVPPNPAGSLGDYFPVLAAPGERVTVQTRAQQNEARTEARIAGGDTYIYNTNVYNPLAAAMLADQQRRERVARSNARMGVT